MNKNPITVETVVKASMSKVWECWSKPEHIMNWAFASDDWEAPAAENDLRVGGKFKTTMAAKDKSASFDFTGIYTDVKEHELIEYDMDDPEGVALRPDGVGGRHVKVKFTEVPADAKALADKSEGVRVVVTFDPENENSEEKQRSGWQAISDNFKKYVESI